MSLLLTIKENGFMSGIPDLLVAVLKEIIELNGSSETKEEVDEVMARIAPRPTPCGIMQTRCVICCPCGEPIPLQIDQPEATSKTVKDLASSLPEGSVHDATPNGIENATDRDQKAMVATNFGHTFEECDHCGRRFVVTLEIHCANISKDVELPRNDLEVPDRSSSGLSPMTSVDGNGTVH
jgi:hypothetical protein